MKQGEQSLQDFLVEFDRITEQLTVPDGTKIDLLASALRDDLKMQLMLRRRASYNEAVRIVTARDSIKPKKDGKTQSMLKEVLKRLDKQESSKNIQNPEVNYADPVEVVRENERLHTQINVMSLHSNPIGGARRLTQPKKQGT